MSYTGARGGTYMDKADETDTGGIFAKNFLGSAELLFDARVVSVTDGGCRDESQNAVGISGVFCRSDIGVWMRWRGNDSATGDQRGGIAKFGERSRGEFTDIHGDGDRNDEHGGDVGSE
jgi:hypothetical protein